MLIFLWGRLRNRSTISCRGKELPKSRCSSFRPKLEVLEDRTLPTALAYGILPPAPAGTTSAAFALPPHQPVTTAPTGALSGLKPIASHPASAAANQITMTVVEYSPASVLDLDAIFSQMSGLHPEDGMQMSLEGNSNPKLVKPSLSDGELTLTFAPPQCGTATITVSATDADGSCVRVNIVVTILPWRGAGSPPHSAGQHTSRTSRTSNFA